MEAQHDRYYNGQRAVRDRGLEYSLLRADDAHLLAAGLQRVYGDSYPIREFYDADFDERHGLSAGIYFDAAHYGADSLQPDVRQFGPGGGAPVRERIQRAVANYPISDRAKANLVELATTTRRTPSSRLVW